MPVPAQEPLQAPVTTPDYYRRYRQRSPVTRDDRFELQPETARRRGRERDSRSASPQRSPIEHKIQLGVEMTVSGPEEDTESWTKTSDHPSGPSASSESYQAMGDEEDGRMELDHEGAETKM
jgi:hypothetical protein